MSSTSYAQLRVAVVDSGLNLNDERFSNVLCKTGHWDFVDNSAYPIDHDVNGHGTHVAGTIKKYAGNSDYCLIILAYYSAKVPAATNILNLTRAFQHAVNVGARIVNYSGGGPTFNENEYATISSAKNVTFVVAAGNDNKDLDLPENKFYPASYLLKNIISVGALQTFGLNEHSINAKLKTSNYGKTVKVWEAGENIRAELPNYQFGYKSGTSMATAVATGKLIKKRSE